MDQNPFGTFFDLLNLFNLVILKLAVVPLQVDIDGFHLSDKFPARTALQNVFILLKVFFHMTHAIRYNTINFISPRILR